MQAGLMRKFRRSLARKLPLAGEHRNAGLNQEKAVAECCHAGRLVPNIEATSAAEAARAVHGSDQRYRIDASQAAHLAGTRYQMAASLSRLMDEGQPIYLWIASQGLELVAGPWGWQS